MNLKKKNEMEITKEEAEKLKSEILNRGTDWEGLESNCCGASIIWCDICNDCKEHCEPACFDENYFEE